MSLKSRSKDVALCLYRVAQESLNNALKHARTLVVAVTITKVQDKFYMTIQDCGVGFDDNKNSQGLGLISMSERLSWSMVSSKYIPSPGVARRYGLKPPISRPALICSSRTANLRIPRPLLRDLLRSRLISF